MLKCIAVEEYIQFHTVFYSLGQSFLNYVGLLLVYTLMLACRKNDENLLSLLKLRGWKYAILALIDVEANYFIVKAYQYTTITSVQVMLYHAICIQTSTCSCA